MRLKLTLLRAAAEPVDLAVTVDASATIRDVARALCERDQAAAPGARASGTAALTLRVHGTPGTAETTTLLLPPDVAAAEAVRSGSVVSLASAAKDDAPGASPTAPVAVARLRVLAGPDAGLEVPLPEGATVIGRGRGCDVRLSDPTVSREHARIAVADVVEIADLRSANGLRMGAGPVQRAAILPEDTVTLGDTTISVARTCAPRPASPGPARVAFNRSPRIAPRYEGEEVEAPAPPEPPRPGRFPVVVLLVPLVMAPVLLLGGRDALSLALLAMMPLLVIGNVLDQRLTGRRTYRAAVVRFTQTIDAVRAEREAERERERAVRSEESPSVDELVAASLVLGPLLWTRRPEHEAFLDLRLGVGTVRSRSAVTLPARNNAAPDYWDKVVALQRDVADIDGVPVTVQLRESGALGLAGPRAVLDDAVRAIVAQVAALHSPAEVVLALATSTASARRWDWARWLPHVGSVHSPLAGPHIGSDHAGVARLASALEGLVEERRTGAAGRGRGAALPVVVLVVEDDAPIERGRLVRLAEEGAAVGVHVVWCADTGERLPAACRTFVTVSASPDAGTAGFVRTAAHVQPLRCDVLGATAVEGFARHLAAVVDAGAPIDDASDLPDRVSYLDLVGVEMSRGGHGVLERWRENGSLTPRDGRPPQRRTRDADLRALVGQGAAEPLTLDLRTQGPHALVGGTTGAGKSELLQSWVLGMATAHSPDRVTFLLVDYKGGAAFADCVDLPHVVGLVTDLTPHLVRRALTSLRAELRHRERLLGRKGVKDLPALERTGDPECPPSLVIVVDEFAALVAEVPEFVDGVVDVAQRGRSLGLHLVLATQRPAGVIRENLRANTNLRVALRMNDVADSMDFLGVPLAAGFDPALPGRGAARTGPGRVTLFQTGYASGRTGEADPGAGVVVETLPMGAGTRWETPGDLARAAAVGPGGDEGPTDLTRLVASVREAARAARVPAPRRPWLPTLAPVQDLAALGPGSDGAIVLGVVDDPAHQRQVTAYYRPDAEGNVVFSGASGSGKSTALRTLALAAGGGAVVADGGGGTGSGTVAAAGGGPVHVYGLDLASGGLAPLEPLPHVGAVIDGSDTERVQRLLRRLRDVVEERAGRYARARASTIEEYRTLSGRADEPRILLLVDGFGAFRAEWEAQAARMPAYQHLLQVLGGGRGVGVHVALTADWSGAVPPSVAGSVPRAVVLRQADESAYAMLGAPRDVLDPTSPPGRAISPDGLEMQVAVLGASASLAEQVRAIEELAVTLRRAGAPPAPEVRRLPELVPAGDMPRDIGGLPVLGVADDTLAPVGFEPAGTFLLAGPPRSGRTNALRWLAESVAAAHPGSRLVYLGARRSPLAGLALWTHAATGVAAVAALAREVLDLVTNPPDEGRAGDVLVLESLPDFLGTAAELPLTEVITAVKRNEHLVIAEGETSTWGSSWPLVAEVRNGRRGLVLQPDQVDGDALFRTAFPRGTRREFPVGRGMVVDGASVQRVQVPLVTAAASGPPAAPRGRHMHVPPGLR